jgi:hypothetical protein
MPALLGAGCSSLPYQPLVEPLPAAVPGGGSASPLAEAASSFRSVVLAARSFHPRLETVDVERQRIQSAFDSCELDGIPGRSRLTAWIDSARLHVVVEVQWLYIDWLGTPRWTNVRGWPEREREIADAMLATWQTGDPPDLGG